MGVIGGGGQEGWGRGGGGGGGLTDEVGGAEAAASAGSILFAARGWGGVRRARETGGMRWAGQGRADEGEGKRKVIFYMHRFDVKIMERREG